VVIYRNILVIRALAYKITELSFFLAKDLAIYVTIQFKSLLLWQQRINHL